LLLPWRGRDCSP